MSKELIRIHNTDIQSIEHKGQRVITLDQMDHVHERPKGTARRNFNQHKSKMKEGKHYFRGKALDAVRLTHGMPDGIILLTEKGYKILVKSFRDKFAQDLLIGIVKSPFISSDYKEYQSDKARLNEGYLYVVEFTPTYPVKIGVSINPVKRLETLQSGSPVPLHFLYLWKVSNMQKVEKSLHNKFAKYRKHGEWFLLSQESRLELLEYMSDSALVAQYATGQGEFFSEDLHVSMVDSKKVYRIRAV